MLFTVLPRATWPRDDAPQGVYLITDNWDDYGYKTQYDLVWASGSGALEQVGPVKIGQFGMGDSVRPEIVEQFNRLSDRYFSLGQDPGYYEVLNRLGDSTRDLILSGLRDLAVQDESFLRRALQEHVTRTSLMRAVPYSTLMRQFRRIARGGARLTEYRFAYDPPGQVTDWTNQVPSLEFEVDPDSLPPTNVHILIGRNGVGKSTLLQQMARALVDERPVANTTGRFRELSPPAPWEQRAAPIFANVVSVSFSAFDNFTPVESSASDIETAVGYSYIGLHGRPSPGTNEGRPRTLASDFANSVRLCLHETRRRYWLQALAALDSDPIFSDAQAGQLIEVSDDELEQKSVAVFNGLSSGHKIVLLAISRLVETVEERSLVLIDEPESHLHPPLLSAFMRALSELLADRNGVAIVATHSPVVLQEVPRSCVWKIRRSGWQWVAERPEIETFGENVGLLTHNVFGLEVLDSGFLKMLRDTVAEGGSYDDVVAKFSGQLGGEARALIYALIAERDSGQSL